MTDARKTAIEAMARATDPVGWDWYDKTEDDPNKIRQLSRNLFYAEQIKRQGAALDALLAALPGLGLRVVPVEPDRGMFHAAEREHTKSEIQNYGRNASDDVIWDAMIAAAPDVLGGGSNG